MRGFSVFLDLVRKFVSVVGTARKVDREQLSGPFDTIEQSFGELTAFKMLLHAESDSAPKVVAAFLMDASVPHDGERVRSRCEENQYTVSLSGPCHSEPLEMLFGNRHRFFRFLPRNQDSNFA